MNIYIPRPESYFEFSEDLEEKLQVPASCSSLLPFLSVDQALFDIATTLAQTYSHKLSIALIEGTGPFFDRLAIHFSRLGYNVQKFSRKSDKKISDWIEGLNKDTLFVLADLDEVFTGELFDVSHLCDALNEKKVMQILLSHTKHKFYSIDELGDYEIRICTTSNRAALSLLGGRAKVQPVHTLSHDWKAIEAKHYLELFDKDVECREDVEKLESVSHAGSKAYFGADFEDRLFDRAVLHWNDIDGFAFIHQLSQLLGNGSEGFEATSLCRWTGVSDFAWLNGDTRGLVVIHKDQLSSALPGKISEAHEAVLRRQSGN